MWIMFVIGAIVTAIVTLAIIKIGHKICLSMIRDEEKLKIEEEFYQKVKDNVKENN